MNSCDDAIDVLRYIDNDLSGPELEAFRAHLQSCPTCKVRLEEERAFSSVLHRSRPLYRAPEQLRSQVAELLKQHPGARGVPGIYEWLVGILERPFLNRWPHFQSLGMWVSTLVLVSVCLIFSPGVARRVHSASYVEAAVAAHRSYLEGSLASEIRSDSPAFVTAWFASRFRSPSGCPPLKVAILCTGLRVPDSSTTEGSMRRWSSMKRQGKRSVSWWRQTRVPQ